MGAKLLCNKLKYWGKVLKFSGASRVMFSATHDAAALASVIWCGFKGEIDLHI